MNQKTPLPSSSPYYQAGVYEKARSLFHLPLFDLIGEAHDCHRQHWQQKKNKEPIQKSRLLSIKTGGCQEDCGYCAQSRHYETSVLSSPPLPIEKIKEEGKKALSEGATRFCLGAAWRRPAPALMSYLCQAVKVVKDLGLETCLTLGSLTLEQAKELKKAGCDFYNHNIDTSPEYYPKVVTTREFSERLQTLAFARKAGLKVCSGGILGLGEKPEDRISFLSVLGSLDPHPESVPINQLVSIEGTPLAKQAPLETADLIRVIAVARLLMPQSRIRLAAGRLNLSSEAQFLCFLAGANSLFVGDKLLTTPLPGVREDETLFQTYFKPFKSNQETSLPS